MPHVTTWSVFQNQFTYLSHNQNQKATNTITMIKLLKNCYITVAILALMFVEGAVCL